MKEIARAAYLPVILGGGIGAFRPALRAYLLYGLHSYRFDTEVFRWEALLPFLQVQKLKKTLYSQPLLWELIRFAEEHPEQICLLIPVSQPFRDFISKHREELESFFLLSDGKLSNIPFLHGKVGEAHEQKN